MDRVTNSSERSPPDSKLEAVTLCKPFRDGRVDPVGNDSGGGIAQIFAVLYPTRVRSLMLTDCDTHDNWPPEAFNPFLAMAAGGGLRGTLDAMLSDRSVYRSPQALGLAYEHPERLSDDSIEIYLFLGAFDNKHTLAIEARLKTLKVPNADRLGNR